MKAKKFFALAIAALAIVGCTKPNGDEPEQPGKEADLALSETSKQIAVEESFDLTATVAAEFAVNKEDVVQLVPANDGKSVKVTGVAEGNVIITATTKGGQSKTCVVLVKKATQGGEGGEGAAAEVKGSQFWPIFMDDVTLAANSSKLVADFRYTSSDQVHFYFPWDGANFEFKEDAPGLNAAGNDEGFVSLLVTQGGTWAGGGIALESASDQGAASVALLADIVAHSDQYFMHMSIKSADQASHCFYIFACDKMSFVLGQNAVYGGTIYGNFTRDGSWHEFDIPMSQFVTDLASVTDFNGTNIFVALSEYIPGSLLNLDLVYFYKK